MSVKESIGQLVDQFQLHHKKFISELESLGTPLEASDADEAEAKEYIEAIKKLEDFLSRDNIKFLVEDVALSHKIEVYLGDCGNGESLLVEDDGWWGTAGEWISSSETC